MWAYNQTNMFDPHFVFKLQVTQFPIQRCKRWRYSTWARPFILRSKIRFGNVSEVHTWLTHKRWQIQYELYIIANKWQVMDFWIFPFDIGPCYRSRSKSRSCTFRLQISLKLLQNGQTLLLPPIKKSHMAFRLIYINIYIYI